ncbi:MAG: transporter [Gemmatimonadota bacterium]|nr:MAG: transporter [Gemmatimonadota bacterium]
MARISIIAGLVAAFALTAASAAAQDDDYMFDRDRPDGFGPPGVSGQFTVDAGEILWSFTYSRDDLVGNRNGTAPLFQQEVLDLFTVAPVSLLTQTLNLEVRLGITDRFTLAVSAPYIFRDGVNETETAFFASFANDIGDLEVNTLWDLLNPGAYVLTLGMGVSIPTGDIDERGRTATSSLAQLPFSMQTGSGSWELMPSVSFMTQNDAGTFGAQVGSTFHLNDNDRNYRLGDRFDMTTWVSYNVNDWIALSARVVYEEWASVTGIDPETNGIEDPRANPFATGGVRTQLPFGFTLRIREGVLKGHRFSVEYLTPIHQDLNGPQLQTNNTVLVGWQVVF